MNISLRQIIQKLKLRYGSEATVNKTLRAMGLRIGERTRVYTLRFPSEPYLVRIGDHCTIAPDVTFVTHNANTMLQDKYESLTGFGFGFTFESLLLLLRSLFEPLLSQDCLSVRSPIHESNRTVLTAIGGDEFNVGRVGRVGRR